MKIIIVGAGISGLSLSLFLHTHLRDVDDLEIAIYESHRPRATSTQLQTPHDKDANFPTQLIGGGLGISPNGLRALHACSPAVYQALTAQSFVAKSFVFAGAPGWKLASVPTTDRRIDSDIGEQFCLSTSRQGVWQCLRDACVDNLLYRTVDRIEQVPGGGARVYWTSADGDSGVEDADLVVGADGVHSRVRDALFPPEEVQYQPHYEGQAGVGGFIEMDIPDDIEQTRAMVFTFGRTGFFGYSPYTLNPRQLMWWSTFSCPDPPGRKVVDGKAVREQLIQRHGAWKDPVIKSIIQTADVDSVYPTYVMPELPHWGEGAVCLIGDAAHALSPTTGQGVSQGVEDAQVLALLLGAYLSQAAARANQTKQGVELAIKGLHAVKMGRVKEIATSDRKINERKGVQGVIQEYVMYLFLWLIGTFPKVGGVLFGFEQKRLEQLYGWDAELEVEKWIEEHPLAYLDRMDT